MGVTLGSSFGWALISSPGFQYYVFVKLSCLPWAPAHIVSCSLYRLNRASLNKRNFF